MTVQLDVTKVAEAQASSHFTHTTPDGHLVEETLTVTKQMYVQDAKGRQDDSEQDSEWDSEVSGSAFASQIVN